jgi:hypothetical protein
MKPPAISAIQEIELNIDPGTEIDPWPRYGLAAKYKPFILNRVKPFLQNNGHLNRNEVITDAIRITWEASQKFKQELGYDFSTYLRHLLPNRLYDLYGIEKSKKDEEEPDILKTEPLQFLGGGNGTRLVLDTGVLSVGVRVTLITCSARLSAFGIIRPSSPVTTRTHKPFCGPLSTIPSAGSGRFTLKPNRVALCSWRHETSKPISVCSRTIGCFCSSRS